MYICKVHLWNTHILAIDEGVVTRKSKGAMTEPITTHFIASYILSSIVMRPSYVYDYIGGGHQ